MVVETEEWSWKSVDWSDKLYTQPSKNHVTYLAQKTANGVWCGISKAVHSQETLGIIIILLFSSFRHQHQYSLLERHLVGRLFTSNSFPSSLHSRIGKEKPADGQVVKHMFRLEMASRNHRHIKFCRTKQVLLPLQQVKLSILYWH